MIKNGEWEANRPVGQPAYDSATQRLAVGKTINYPLPEVHTSDGRGVMRQF